MAGDNPSQAGRATSLKARGRRSAPVAARKFLLILAGAALAALLVEFSLRLSGFSLWWGHEAGNRASMRRNEIRVLCLGESTTMGQYPRMSEQFLNDDRDQKTFALIDKGVGGTNTGIILAKLEGYLDQYQPEVVVTMMGANDLDWSVPLEEKAGPRQKIFRGFTDLRIVKLLRLVVGRKDKRHSPNPKLLSKGEKNYLDLVAGHSLEKQDPSDPVWAHLAAAAAYQERGDWQNAEVSYRKAIGADPRSEWSRLSFAYALRRRGERRRAEEWCRKALEINPFNKRIYLELGTIYDERDDWSRAAAYYEKAAELDPTDDFVYHVLAGVYRRQGDLDAAERWVRKALEINSDAQSERVLEAEQLRRWGSPDNGAVGDKYYRPITARNYRALRDAVLRRKIKLVCVEYPLRSIRELKEIVGDFPNVFFVDNEKIFQEAVNQDGYWAYFKDRFAGEFGHCTQKGNELLARNIARTIQEEVYGSNGPN